MRDGRHAYVIHGGNTIETVELSPGLHIITTGNVDDPRDERHEFVRRMLTLHTLDSAVTFLAVASRVFSRKPDSEGRAAWSSRAATSARFSSTLLSLPRKTQHAIYQYAPAPPCDCAYDDLSALLRQVLSTERARKNREGDGDDAKHRETPKAKADHAKHNGTQNGKHSGKHKEPAKKHK